MMLFTNDLIHNDISLKGSDLYGVKDIYMFIITYYVDHFFENCLL